MRMLTATGDVVQERFVEQVAVMAQRQVVRIVPIVYAVHKDLMHIRMPMATGDVVQEQSVEQVVVTA